MNKKRKIKKAGKEKNTVDYDDAADDDIRHLILNLNVNGVKTNFMHLLT